MPAGEFSSAELSKKSHAELKELCREAGVAVSGTKAKLMENLLNPNSKKKARTNDYHPAVSPATTTSSNIPSSTPDIRQPGIHEHFRKATFTTGIQRINSPPKQARSQRPTRYARIPRI
jgi:hypothetical protein